MYKALFYIHWNKQLPKAFPSSKLVISYTFQFTFEIERKCTAETKIDNNKAQIEREGSRSLLRRTCNLF